MQLEKPLLPHQDMHGSCGMTHTCRCVNAAEHGSVHAVCMAVIGAGWGWCTRQHVGALHTIYHMHARVRPCRCLVSIARCRTSRRVCTDCEMHVHSCMPLPRPAQVSSEWRKVSSKLEGEPEFDALDKLERLETFQVCGYVGVGAGVGGWV